MFQVQDLELRAMIGIIFPNEQSLCVRPVSLGSCMHLIEEEKWKAGCCQTPTFNTVNFMILKLGHLKKR